jgi:streptogramin lyase
VTVAPNGVVWFTDTTGQVVRRFNPATETLLATIAVAGGPWGIAFDGAAMRVTRTDAGMVTAINATTGAVGTSVPTPAGVTGPRDIGTASDGSVWYLAASDDLVKIGGRNDNVAEYETAQTGIDLGRVSW